MASGAADEIGDQGQIVIVHFFYGFHRMQTGTVVAGGAAFVGYDYEGLFLDGAADYRFTILVDNFPGQVQVRLPISGDGPQQLTAFRVRD